jgi:predicted RNase H-like HicB family nuclease
MSTEVRREIRLIEEDDGWWSAIDEAVGVASQGETREDALANLDEAVALHTGEAGEPIEDEEAFLRDLGIDPEEVEGAEDRDLPEFMQ